MKNLNILTISLFFIVFSCSIENIDKTSEVRIIDSSGPIQLYKGKPIKDPAITNKKKVIFTETVEGTYEEKLASMVITESHAKPISLNWNLGDEFRIVKVVLVDSNGNWKFQTRTSGWRGFWVADSLIKGETYTLLFLELNIEVDFIWNGKQ